MKFIGIVATAFYLKSVDASVQSLQKVQNEFIKAMGGNNRNLMLETVSTLNKYGCWCFFDQDLVGVGKGLPRDFIDEECKALHRGYTCAMAEIPNCVPYTVFYNAATQALNQPGVNGDIKRACELANGNDACRVAACTLETKFIQNVNSYLLTQDADYIGLTHKGQAIPANEGGGIGTFNYERECVAECPKGTCYSDREERACCGEYPERFPFKLHDGDAVLEQKCCGRDWTHWQSGAKYQDVDGNNIGGINTYNTATHNCVNNVVVKK